MHAHKASTRKEDGLGLLGGTLADRMASIGQLPPAGDSPSNKSPDSDIEDPDPSSPLVPNSEQKAARKCTCPFLLKMSWVSAPPPNTAYHDVGCAFLQRQAIFQTFVFNCVLSILSSLSSIVAIEITVQRVRSGILSISTLVVVLGIFGLRSGHKRAFGDFQMLVACAMAISGGFLFVAVFGTDTPEHKSTFWHMIPVHIMASVVMAIMAINSNTLVAFFKLYRNPVWAVAIFAVTFFSVFYVFKGDFPPLYDTVIYLAYCVHASLVMENTYWVWKRIEPRDFWNGVLLLQLRPLMWILTCGSPVYSPCA